MKLWWRRVLAVVVVGGLTAGAWFGGRWSVDRVTARAGEPEASPQFESYTVTDGQIGATRSLTATVEWTQKRVVKGGAEGVVTWLPESSSGGIVLDEGAVAMRVDQRPVVVAAGAVPMFRDLEGGERGDDVAQLQTFLARLGLLEDGVQLGRYDGITRRAVRAWQKGLGVTDASSGTVEAADVLFVEDLPLVATTELVVGDLVTVGDDMFSVIEPEPTFTVRAPESGPNLPSEAPVSADFKGNQFDGLLGPVSTDEDDTSTYRLTTADGSAICADRCDLFPVGVETAIRVEVELSPTVAGPMVPVAALQTNAEGSTFVTDGAGGAVSVEVLGSADGIAVVSGVAAGDSIRIRAVPEG